MSNELIEINIKMSPGLEQQIERALEQFSVGSQQAFVALEKMAHGLERYALIQTILLSVLVFICVLTLVLLIVRDAQLRRHIVGRWRRLWGARDK